MRSHGSSSYATNAGVWIGHPSLLVARSRRAAAPEDGVVASPNAGDFCPDPIGSGLDRVELTSGNRSSQRAIAPAGPRTFMIRPVVSSPQRATARVLIDMRKITASRRAAPVALHIAASKNAINRLARAATSCGDLGEAGSRRGAFREPARPLAHAIDIVEEAGATGRSPRQYSRSTPRLTSAQFVGDRTRQRRTEAGSLERLGQRRPGMTRRDRAAAY